MIKIDLSNLYKVTEKHGLSKEELFAKKELLPDYLKKIQARNQGFYKIIDDKSQIDEINDFELKSRGKYNHIVVLGIGGSALGTICLQQSLTHLYQKTIPELYVVDNIDPIIIKELEEVIDYEKTLFIVVTKSGTTPEILSLYNYFRTNIEDKDLSPKDHFVFITDPEKGTLRKISNKESIPAFSIPENVGGRFSVLTPVGLLPARLIGIDINRLIAGAKEARDQFLSEDIENNLSFQFATIQYLLDQKGKVINIMMPYSQKLIRFADWYRQLLAESIGKKFDNSGKEVNIGLTPINALGVTDQHSQSQLYNEGPNDKLIIFIENTHPLPNIKIPKVFNKDVTFKKLLNIELEATATSLTKNNRPNFKVQVDSISEETLGSLFMLMEGATAFLGEFYQINAFDQPGVELSKNLTREALS